MAQLLKSPPPQGDLGLISGLGRSPGEGNGYPLQYSGLENSMDYSPWGCTELDTFYFQSKSDFHSLGKITFLLAMALKLPVSL